MRKLLVVLGMVLAVNAVAGVTALCDCPCPSAAPWVKVDGLTSTTFTYTPPECKKVVKVCYKSSTTCKDFWADGGCGEPVVVTSQVFNQNGQRQALSHASFLLETCCVPPTPTPPPPTPTPPPPTPTPPPPTPTPGCEPNEEGKAVCTDQDCGKTLEWINNCGEKKYVVCEACECVPDTECHGRCGRPSDGCGGHLDCGLCPPPPPPPGKWPTPGCNVCEFSQNLSIESYKGENLWHAEWFYFLQEKAVYQIVLDMYEDAEYVIFAGKKDPNDSENRVILKATGKRTVTIPWPLAGLPVQQWTYLSFKGGAGRMTIWMANKNFVSVVEETYTVAILP